METKPLDDLEMFDLLVAAYPERFSYDNETWDKVQEFAGSISGWDEVADLLGRVAMLTMPMSSGLTGRRYHCLGPVSVYDGSTHMMAAVRRDFTPPVQE